MSFLTGKVDNPAKDLRKDYAGAYSELLKGGGNDPFTKLFQGTLAPTLAQAKESVGNLTGTGLVNTIGDAAGRSLSQFLLSILGQGSQFSTNATPTYTPGFLDYLVSGVKGAAPAFAGAGGAAALASRSAGRPPTSVGDFPLLPGDLA